ncbi:MAG TPA: phage integrase SAM-like domain-containing protein [Nostocaceae cyanobacterium]|nr:phage integrase SAM-like domain-containing protein [Nostocaceae cyanobacterium]
MSPHNFTKFNNRITLDLWLGKQKNRTTRKDYENIVLDFIIYYLIEKEYPGARLNDIDLRIVTVEHIEEYMKKKESLAKSTQNKRLRCLKSFLSYACEINYLTFNAVENYLELPKFDKL